MTIFGPSWDALDLEAVRAFLADSDEEPLTWEAKGTKVHPDSVRKHAAGFANREGGYLILGADQDKRTRTWSVEGVEFPDDEPQAWLDKVIGALRPEPRRAFHVWRLEGRTAVAVVRVDAVAKPPCITPGGTVYERVSGGTVPVQDPLALDRLFQRGAAADQLAREAAAALAGPLLAKPPIWGASNAVLSLALAAVGRPMDAHLRPFRESFADKLVDSAFNRLRPDQLLAPTRHLEMSQDAIVIGLAGHEYAYALAASRATAVGLMFAAQPSETNLSHVIEGPLPRMWKYAADRVTDLGGYDRAYLEIQLNTAHPDVARRQIRPRVEIHRWVPVAHPDAAALSSVSRELRRGAGQHVFEPEPG